MTNVDLDSSVAVSSFDTPEVADHLEEGSGSPGGEDEEEPTELEEPTAAEIVRDGVTQGQLDVVSLSIDQRELDATEERLIQEFTRDGCKCDLGPNHSPCCTSIKAEHFRSVRCQMAELTHDELDLVVMGQVMAGCFSEETFRGQERNRSFTVFHHNGTRICQKSFLFLHTMGYSRFMAIKASYKASGVVARVHGNRGKSNRKDRLTLQEIEDVVQFIMNYTGMYNCEDCGGGGVGEEDNGKEKLGESTRRY